MSSEKTNPIPPAGAIEVGDWSDFGDRFYRLEPTEVDAVAVNIGGLQNRDGFCWSGVTVRIPRAVVIGGQSVAVSADLSAEQARQLGRLLIEQADQCDALEAVVPLLHD